MWSFWSQKPKNYLMPHKRMPHDSLTAAQLYCAASLMPKPPFPFPLQLHPLGTFMLSAYTWGLMTSLPLTHSLSPEKLAL